MTMKSGDFSMMVFKRIDRSDIGEFSIDGQILSVLMALDGKKTVKDVAKNLQMSMDILRKIISRLLKVKLIEQVKSTVSNLDRDFFDFLNIQLSLAIGPLSAILIEDAIQDLGYRMNNFPCHRAAELVDMISREIHREDKKNIFKKEMLLKIKEIQ